MSTPSPKFKAQIDKGMLVMEDEEAFGLHLATLEGDDVSVTVRKWRTKRTSNQNRYLFGGVYPIISRSTGHTKDELHLFYKTMFLKKRVAIMGKEYTVVRSTTDLNTKEFTEYIRSVKNHALRELDIFVPEPEELDLPKYY